jgi:hypothetical protein
MDFSTEIRALTSLRWFLFAHADDLPNNLLVVLVQGQRIEELSEEDLIHRLRELQRDQINQLCSAIEDVHRSYFGSLNGRELSSFLRRFADESATARGSAPIGEAQRRIA